jgi:probable rRNA maturation factor
MPTIALTTRGGPFPDAPAAVIRRRAAKMLACLGLGDVELSIALVDDATIRALNRDFRRKDKPTDVLSFPMLEPPPGGPPRVSARARKKEGAPGAPRFDQVTGVLGDVIISIETARRQASANERALLAEITMLLAHGLLHLLGYDHRTDAEERAMTEATQTLERAAEARRAEARPDAAGKTRRPRSARGGRSA